MPTVLLGRGGQGEVWATGDPAVVVKLYLPAALTGDARLGPRLATMVRRRPPPPRSDGRPVLTWPTAVVREEKQLAGFLMAAVDVEATAELHEAVNPADRLRHPWLKDWTWWHQVSAAAELSRVVAVLHKRDVIIGDFNERNVLLWSNAAVTLIDCDSMQLPGPAGEDPFLCRVGRPELTPPELLGASWDEVPRTVESDLYALAIHIHQLLLEGEHPFRGRWHGKRDKPDVTALAAEGLWTHRGDPLLSPRAACPPLELLGPVGDLLRQAFVEGATDPGARPGAAAWVVALDQLAADLVWCDEGHAAPEWLQDCPWCVRAATAAPQVLARPVTVLPTPAYSPPAWSQAPGQPLSPGRRQTARKHRQAQQTWATRPAHNPLARVLKRWALAPRPDEWVAWGRGLLVMGLGLGVPTVVGTAVRLLLLARSGGGTLMQQLLPLGAGHHLSYVTQPAPLVGTASLRMAGGVAAVSLICMFLLAFGWTWRRTLGIGLAGLVLAVSGVDLAAAHSVNGSVAAAVTRQCPSLQDDLRSCVVPVAAGRVRVSIVSTTGSSLSESAQITVAAHDPIQVRVAAEAGTVVISGDGLQGFTDRGQLLWTVPVAASVTGNLQFVNGSSTLRVTCGSGKEFELNGLTGQQTGAVPLLRTPNAPAATCP